MVLTTSDKKTKRKRQRTRVVAHRTIPRFRGSATRLGAGSTACGYPNVPAPP
jgi:hypothetical protein